MQHINKTIKLEKNLGSRQQAINMAGKYLVEENAIPDDTCGFVYINGPTISDLLIISPAREASRARRPKLRACTDKEWNKYFGEYLTDSKNI